MPQAASGALLLAGCLLLGARAASLRELPGEAERLPTKVLESWRSRQHARHRSEEERGAECAWPRCTKRCDVCAHRRVGTCVGKSIGLQVPGCYSAHAECILTRCVCQDGMCASPFENGTCIPTTCHEGARPKQPVLAGFARFFADTSFRDDDTIRHSWQKTGELTSVITTSSVSLCVTIITGLFIAAMTGVRLLYNTCCPCLAVHRNQRRRKAEDMPSPPESPTLKRITLRMLTIEEDPVEPTYWPMIVFAAVITITCIAGIVIRDRTTAGLFGIIEWQVVHAARNAGVLAKHAKRLNHTSVTMQSTLAAIPDACSSNALLADIAGVGAASMKEYVSEISHYASVIEPMPLHLLRLTGKINSEHSTYAKLPMIPLIIMGILAVGIVLEALYIRFHRDKGHAIRRLDRWIVPKAFIYAAFIFTTAVFIAMETTIAFSIGVVCDTVDEFVLKVIKYQTIQNNVNSTDPYNIARFYILGDIYNPLDSYTSNAKLYIDLLDDIYLNLEPLVNVTELTCPQLINLDIPGVRDEAHDILRESQSLLSAANIHLYYDQLVHHGLCNVLPDSIGYMLIFQMVIGLILFPIHTIVTHKFLCQTSSWLLSINGKEVETSDEESSDSGSE